MSAQLHAVHLQRQAALASGSTAFHAARSSGVVETDSRCRTTPSA